MISLFKLKVMHKTQPLCYESYVRVFSLCERIYAWILCAEQNFSANENQWLTL
jgi:hypothetical protein